jgi:hypothetical protein
MIYGEQKFLITESVFSSLSCFFVVEFFALLLKLVLPTGKKYSNNIALHVISQPLLKLSW